MKAGEQTPRCELPRYQSRELIALGFDPGIPIYRAPMEFGLDLVERALFHSTASNPVPLSFTVEDRNGVHEPTAVRLAVEFVQAVYPFKVLEPEAPHTLECLEVPEFYLVGYLIKPVLHPDPDRIKINAYLMNTTEDEGLPDMALLQLVRCPSDANPSSALVCGDGVPGFD